MTDEPRIALPPEYGPLLEDLKERIRTAQVRAALSVNRELVLLYWQIGRRILAAQKTQGWGAKVIERLSRDLRHEFPQMKGFSPRNLKYMRAFAEAWPDEPFVQQPAAQIPWFHNCLLLDRLKDPELRVWYLQQTVANGWSRNVLALRLAAAALAVGALCASAPAPAARPLTTYRIETIAGIGRPGDLPAGGAPALEAPVDLPFGVENGPDGALYVTCVGSHRVLRLDRRSGRLTSVAGNGHPGYSGDGGPATTASLNEPYEVRFDSHGNMLILEMQNHVLRRVAAGTGIISTVAGTGVAGYSGDGGPARAARFRNPHSFALDRADNIYLSDLANNRVRRIDARSGRIETVLGNGQRGLPAEGSLGKEQPFSNPQGLAVGRGMLWVVSDSEHTVWRMDLRSGRVYRVAGTGRRGYTGDGGDPLQATLDGPRGLMLATSGVLYIPEGENNVIRAVDPDHHRIWTVAGVGPDRHLFAGDGVPAVTAPIWQPHGVCSGPRGSLIFGDSRNHRVRMLVPQ